MVISQKVLDALKTIGLNLYERKLYTSLLALGNATAGELAEVSKVPRSRIYDVLESLADKGFVIIQPGRPIRYIAIEPKEALQRWKKRYEEKIREMQQRIDEILKSQIIEEMEKVWKKGLKAISLEEITGTLKGKNSFFDQFESLFKNCKEKVEIIAPSKVLKELYENFAELFLKAKENEIKMRFAATDIEDPETLKLLSQFGEVKVVEKEKVPIDGSIIIFDNENVLLTLTSIKEAPPSSLISLWSKSDFTVKNLIKPIFEIIWQNSRNL